MVNLAQIEIAKDVPVEIVRAAVDAAQTVGLLGTVVKEARERKEAWVGLSPVKMTAPDRYLAFSRCVEALGPSAALLIEIQIGILADDLDGKFDYDRDEDYDEDDE